MRPQKYNLDWFRDFGNLLFPKVCDGCGTPLNSQEDLLCLTCLYQLPRTNFHLYKANPIAQKFWGRTPINEAFSFLLFEKGNMTQRLLHALKYRHRQDIGERLGLIFGRDLAEDSYSGPDYIIPLPLHETKHKIRGYNQCTSIVNGMTIHLGIPVLHDAVKRITANATQTNKGRFERWLNVENIFAVVSPEILSGKHILLVDDVITTGSTLEACAKVLLASGVREVSLATLACA